VIADAGLPVPIKSACFYCPASKKAEVICLRDHHPDLLERALAIERNAQAKLTSVKGLGRSYAWEAFLTKLDDLPLFPSCDGCRAAGSTWSPTPRSTGPGAGRSGAGRAGTSWSGSGRTSRTG
jgi:hypothetical protein